MDYRVPVMSEESANEKKHPSFGRYLQEIRLRTGKTLDDISGETRIAKHVLKFIENEDIPELPDSLYVKGFLQLYAKAIDADGEYAVRSYLSKINTMQTAAKEAAELLKTSPKTWSQILLFLGILSCLIIVSVFLIFPSNKSGEQDNGLEHDPAVEQPAAYSEPGHEDGAGADSMASQVPAGDEKKSEGEQGRMLLRVEAVEETWIKIIVDNEDAKEFNLKLEEHLELEGENGFNILLGNAGGVKLYLNDKPVPVGGKTGQVVNIKIP